MTPSSDGGGGAADEGGTELGADGLAVRVTQQVTAFAGDGARSFLRSVKRAGWSTIDGGARPSRLRVGHGLQLARLRAAVRGRRSFDVDDALGLKALHPERIRDLGPEEQRRVAVGLAVASGAVGLIVVGLPHEPRGLRRETWTLLRWVRDAVGVQILYAADGTAELVDLADELVVVHGGRIHGPAEPWDLLGRTLRGSFAEAFAVESLLGAAVDYLDEDGRWLRVVLDAAGQEVYLPFVRLSPGWRGRIAIRPDAVLLLRERLPGLRGTNHLRGTVAALGDLNGRRRVDVDLGRGELLRAAVEEDTVRGLELTVGSEVFCAFEPAAVRWAGQAPHGSDV